MRKEGTAFCCMYRDGDSAAVLEKRKMKLRFRNKGKRETIWPQRDKE